MQLHRIGVTAGAKTSSRTRQRPSPKHPIMDHIISIGSVVMGHRLNGKLVTIRVLIFSFSIPAKSDVDKYIDKQIKRYTKITIPIARPFNNHHISISFMQPRICSRCKRNELHKNKITHHLERLHCAHEPQTSSSQGIRENRLVISPRLRRNVVWKATFGPMA
jgi:hypothetical protein